MYRAPLGAALPFYLQFLLLLVLLRLLVAFTLRWVAFCWSVVLFVVRSVVLLV